MRFRLRRRRSRPLIVPLIEFLFLLPLLFRRTLLHRRCLPHQRMRLLRSRPLGLLLRPIILVLRLRDAILRRCNSVFSAALF